MSRKTKKPYATVVSEHGSIYVDSQSYDAEFRYPWWLFKVNNLLLFPGFRRDHKKVIYVNGKRCGKADYREGCIPLPAYRIPEEYLSDKWANIFRETFGLRCPKTSRGYYNIRLHSKVYIVVVRRTSEGYLRCIVHRRDSSKYIGDFLFDTTVSVVYPRLQVRGLERTFSIIIGYMMDSLMYATVANGLKRKLEISYQ